ncbi:unnamed protein product, partial [Symbiodinium sp. KB8]
EVPTDELAQLVHFGAWMLEEGARKDLVFVLLLIAGARSTISSALMTRFANAFRKVRDDYVVNHTDQTPSGDGEAADQQRFAALQQVAKLQLKRHWKRYRKVGEE